MNNSLEEKIIALLAQKGKSIKWLCGMLEVSEYGFKQTLQKGSMKVTTLIRVADALNTHITYFFDAAPASTMPCSENYDALDVSTLVELAQRLAQKSFEVANVLSSKHRNTIQTT